MLNLTDLSRAASHALRHEPWLYEIELDDDGWTSVECVLAALRKQRPQWHGLSVADLERMIECSDKRRHEMQGGKIRALYGHSLPGKLRRAPAPPPDVLFHGTSPSFLPAIKSSGLLPMSRQYVHLSTDIETAMAVGARKAGAPILLRILAKRANDRGVKFYIGNEKVWLADQIPPDYLVVDDA